MLNQHQTLQTLSTQAVSRRTALKKLLKVGVGTAFTWFGFSIFSGDRLALAQGVLAQPLRSAFKVLSISVGELVKPFASVARTFRTAAIIGLIGKAIPQTRLSIYSQKHDSRERELQELAVSQEERRLQILEQERKDRLEIARLWRESLREFQAKEIDVKLKEIQASWDEQNWKGVLSRDETRDILTRQQNCFLVLLSPPEISLDAPSSFRNNLRYDLQKVGDFLRKYYPPQEQQRPVKFYDSYFKSPIGDITVEQLYGILSPMPTAILYMKISDYACTFNIGFWGQQSLTHSETSTYIAPISSSQEWNWEEAKKELMAAGADETESLRKIRSSLVAVNKLSAAYITDLHYLSIDPYYEPLLPKLTSEFNQSEFEQEWTKPYVDILKDIQQQGLQTYEEGLVRLANEVQQETIRQNAQKWRLERTLTGGSSWVRSVAISPDGKIVAGGSDKIRLWNLTTGELIQTLEHPISSSFSPSLFSIAFSPDGQMLVSADEDIPIKLWSLKTSKSSSHLSAFHTVAFSPDGQMVAIGDDGGNIRLWDLKNNSSTRNLTGHSRDVYAVAFSPNGQMLASGSIDSTIKLWNPKTGELIRTLTGHSSTVISVAFSPDGKTLASGSFDNTVKLWNWKTGLEIRKLTGHSDWAYSVAFSPDGQILASGSIDKTIKLWNPKTGENVRTLTGHTGAVESIAFSPDGKTLVSGSRDATIKVWKSS